MVVTSGVPQGKVLAPLLILCFINDLYLSDKITSKICLYVDDVLLYSTIIFVKDCYTLQEDLNTLNKWSQTCRMTFNTSKCEFLRIAKKLNLILMQYYIQNDVKEVKYAKYLGVIIDNHLSWNACTY